MFTRNRLGHVQIHVEGYLDKPSLYKTIDNYRPIGDTLEAIDEVEAWAPRLYAAGLLSVGGQSAAARVTGVDSQREDQATNLSEKVAEGSMLSSQPGHEALLGRGLATLLKAHIGDSAVIVSQAADGSIANDRYHIVGIVESGNEMSDRMSFYLHLDDAQELFVLESRVHEIAVVARKSNMARSVSNTIAARIDRPTLSVEPWQVFAKSFYTAMKADKQGMYVFLFIIMLIVAVGVLNTVLMAVLERQREYGLLKALGTKPGGVFRLILWETGLLALASIVVGSGIGALGNYLLSIYGLALPEPISYGGMEFRQMHAEINFRSFSIPALTVMITALAVSIFPALKAARTEPATTMRMH
jgi:ABC-type lipoprotein release transport system permease subunit